MSTPTPPVDRTRPAESSDHQDEPSGEHDVRSGGDASHAPRSLTEVEARWQEHESSGASWDSQESI